MYLAKLYLRNFRTYRSCTLDLQPGLNVFHGENAAGKTNLLEAVGLLATGRSPRAARDAEMAAAGETAFYLKGLIERTPAPLTVEVAWEQQKGKAVRVNGRVQESLAALAGVLPHVYLSPDELAVVNGGPARRRAFLDRLIAQMSPAYSHHLEQYSLALEQRNALLREIRFGSASRDLLPIWDESLAAAGGQIMARRQAVLGELAGLFREEYSRFWPESEPEVAYRPALGTGTLPPGPAPAVWTAGAAANSLAAALKRRREEELARGFTLAGPHRDDLELRIDGLDARLFASQGQRRTLVLSLKLAAARLLERATGQKPLLLLDDALSEMDRRRRDRLLDAARGGNQILLTCTEWDPVKEFADQRGTSYRVEKGGVSVGRPFTG